jgi:hypothetical protein
MVHPSPDDLSVLLVVVEDHIIRSKEQNSVDVK